MAVESHDDAPVPGEAVSPANTDASTTGLDAEGPQITATEVVWRGASYGEACDHTGYQLGSLWPFAPLRDGDSVGTGTAHVTCAARPTSEVSTIRASVSVEGQGGFELDNVSTGGMFSLAQHAADGSVTFRRSDCQRLAMPNGTIALELTQLTLLCPEGPRRDGGAPQCGFLVDVQLRHCDAL